MRRDISIAKPEWVKGQKIIIHFHSTM